MQRFLGSWDIGKKTKEDIETDYKKNKLSKKQEQDIQRAKNYQRFKEDYADAEKADKDIREGIQ